MINDDDGYGQQLDAVAHMSIDYTLLDHTYHSD